MARTGNILSLSSEVRSSVIAELDAAATHIRAGGIVWRSWGRGADLVLLHGGSGSWLHWARNIPVLAGHYRLWVPDLPGHGDSPLADESFFLSEEIENTDCIGPFRAGRMPPPMAGLARYMVRATEELELSEFLIAGFSFGSVVAAHVASRLPDRIVRLILCAPVGLATGPFGKSVNLARWQDADSITTLRAIQRKNLAALMIHDPARIDDLAVDIQIAGTSRAVAPRARRMPTSASVLSNRNIRIGAIWGAEDVLLADRQHTVASALDALDDKARMAVIPDCGHWTGYEQPELFNRHFLEIAAG